MSLVHLLGGAVLCALVAAQGCVRTMDVSIGADCDGGLCNDQPVFAAPPDGGDAEASSMQILACVGTECPAPYATCSANNPCGTNLRNDADHCGACGLRCGGGDLRRLNMTARCVEGTCAYECMDSTRYADCNGILDDGCEVELTADPRNCGGCGIECSAGDRCIEGICGCPSGMKDCGGTCVDTRTSDDNCNACGNVCQTPPDACDPLPPNTKYGCLDGECGKLKCAGLFGDCDGEIGCGSNGCETYMLSPDNCGSCGYKCAPDEECVINANGNIFCKDICEKHGLVTCGNTCTDLLTSPRNCGACAHYCLASAPNQVPVCKDGICDVECAPGFADCNGDPLDGCEVDLNKDPSHCGACGNECDLRAGQPCIEGRCLMVECDAGVLAK